MSPLARVATLMVAGGAASLAVQESQTTDAGAATKKWLDERQVEFAEYHFHRGEQKPVTFTMEPHSLLNWSNPERGAGSGGLFLWTEAGRPAMIACAFEWGGSLKHEFHSLSTEPVVAERGGGVVHRFGPGVEWKSLAQTPQPAEQRYLRLAQMRRLAERFHIRVGNKEWSETRLLTQPVYRSPATAAEDVGVFVFVQGTDPECVLLIQAASAGEWRYALTRQTKWGVKAEFDGAPVWARMSTGRPEADDPQTPFIVLPQKPTAASNP
jgi:hypothetical protein